MSYAALMRALLADSPLKAIRDDEALKGWAILSPGDVPWLNVDDWHQDTTLSRKDDCIRLVLLVAKTEGQGALTRLLTAIERERLKPIVVAPTMRLKAALIRRGWRIQRSIDELLMIPPARDDAEAQG